MKRIIFLFIFFIFLIPNFVFAESLSDYIRRISEQNDSNIVYDITDDRNLRFCGKNPNNYVLFNGEKWRIVGLMNSVRDGEGNISSKVKIVRAKSIGNYSYDSSDSSINNGMVLMNGLNLI